MTAVDQDTTNPSAQPAPDSVCHLVPRDSTRLGPSKPSPEELLEAARYAADQERFSIEHAAALLKMLGGHIGKPHAERDSMEWQALGLRVEYLADQLHQHSEDLAEALERIEVAAGGVGV